MLLERPSFGDWLVRVRLQGVLAEAMDAWFAVLARYTLGAGTRLPAAVGAAERVDDLRGGGT